MINENWFDKSAKEGNITPRMAIKLKAYYKQTIDETNLGHAIKTLNGFCFAGKLIKNKDHGIYKGVNDFVVAQAGQTDEHKSVWVQAIYLTEEELRDLRKCITIALRKAKELDLKSK